MHNCIFILVSTVSITVIFLISCLISSYLSVRGRINIYVSFLSAWWIYFGKYDMIYFTFFIFLWSTFRSDEYNNSLLWNSLLSPVWKTVMSYGATVSIVCFVLTWNSLGEPGKTQKHNKDEKLFCLYLSLSFFPSLSLF